MHCLVSRADGAAIHTNMTLTPSRYSVNALGGPDTATVNVSGDKKSFLVSCGPFGAAMAAMACYAA